MTDDELETCRRGLRAVANRYGLAVAKDPNNQVINAATATFISIDGHKVVVTADHVLSNLQERGLVRIQMMTPEALQMPENLQPLIEFDLSPAGRLLITRGDEKQLDIAVLPAPQELAMTPHVGWFSSETDLDVVEQLRELVPQNRDPRLTTMLFGYPIFSRFRDQELKVQAFGSFPVWGIIERFDDPPEITGRVPQLVFEVDLPQVKDLPSDVSPVVKASVQQFWALESANTASETEPSPFGGYSGGPVVYLCEAGQYLIGITKSGGVLVGGHAFATPLDALVQAVRASWSRAGIV